MADSQQPVTVNPQIEESWKRELADEFRQDYFRELKQFLVQEKRNRQHIFPPGQQIFAAYDRTPFDKVKVVILGQDPYHGPGQAEGLCFSVARGIKIPPSLVNIYKELQSDLGIPIPNHGSLTHWADQGVLLLNAVLTVRAHQANSHKDRGWEQFTTATIKRLAENRSGLVFILWGSYAQKKAAFIDGNRHLILKSPHPSPLSASRGFFGSRPFSQANRYLESSGQQPIDWQIIN